MPIPCRRAYEFKKRCQPRRIQLTKDQNGDLNVETHIMAGCKNLYIMLLIIYAAYKFREPAILVHRPTAEPLVPDTNFVKAENPTKKLKQITV